MPSQKPRYTLRINPLILKKLSYAANYNGRTSNKEIEYLIKKHVEEFEKEHGEINLAD